MPVSFRSRLPICPYLSPFLRYTGIGGKKLKKLKTGYLYSAFFRENPPLKRSEMARVNDGSPAATHTFIIHPRMEWAILPLLPSVSASPNFGRFSYHVPQRGGSGVGLGGWLHTDMVCPPEHGQPSQCQPTDRLVRRPVIELTTIETTEPPT